MDNPEDGEKCQENQYMSCARGFLEGFFKITAISTLGSLLSSHFNSQHYIEKLENEIKERAERRRRIAEQQEIEERKNREKHEKQLIEADNRIKNKVFQYDLKFKKSTQEAEQERFRMSEDNEKHLEQYVTSLVSRSEVEIENARCQLEQKNEEKLRSLTEAEEDRKRVADLEKQEIVRMREENQEIVENHTREQEKIKARQAREEVEFEEELERMEDENRAAREELQRIWDDLLKKMDEQYLYMMKLIAQRQWTMDMEHSFEAKLNFYRSVEQTMQRPFERFTHLLITLENYLQTSEQPENIRYLPVVRQVAELRKAIQKQKEIFGDGISELEAMYEVTEWQFLIEIQKSFENILSSCNNFLAEIDGKYSMPQNEEYIKSGEALRQMNLLYGQLSTSYSQIPTMHSLKSKHSMRGPSSLNEGSSSHREEFHNDQGQIFTIEEPLD